MDVNIRLWVWGTHSINFSTQYVFSGFMLRHKICSCALCTWFEYRAQPWETSPMVASGTNAPHDSSNYFWWSYFDPRFQSVWVAVQYGNVAMLLSPRYRHLLSALETSLRNRRFVLTVQYCVFPQRERVVMTFGVCLDTIQSALQSKSAKRSNTLCTLHALYFNVRHFRQFFKWKE
jgi:hypothetical protein